MAIRVLAPEAASGDGLCDGLRALRAELALELLPAGAGRARLARLDDELVTVAKGVDGGSDVHRQLMALHEVLQSHLLAEVDIRLSGWSEHRSHHLLDRARQSVLAGLDHIVAELRA